MLGSSDVQNTYAVSSDKLNQFEYNNCDCLIRGSNFNNEKIFYLTLLRFNIICFTVYLKTL